MLRIFLSRNGSLHYSGGVKAAPVRPARINPFPSGRDKSHVLLFASANSYVAARTGWTGPHRFRFWVLDVASDGPLRLRVGGREITRPAQSVPVYAPNVAYEEFMQRGNLMRQAWLMFPVADPRSPLSKLVQPDGFRIVDDPGSLVRTYIGQITACFLHPHAGADWFGRGVFYQILGCYERREENLSLGFASPICCSKTKKGRSRGGWRVT